MEVKLRDVAVNNSKFQYIDFDVPSNIAGAEVIWDKILKYFENEDNINNIDVAFNKFRSKLKNITSNSIFLNNKNESIVSLYNRINNEIVKNILDGNAENDDNTIALYSIFYYLIYLSIFPYSEESAPSQFSSFELSNIYDTIVVGDKTYYHFLQNNALFSLFDKFNPMWRSYETYDILTKGYFIEKDKRYYLFQSEVEIKELIFKSLVGDIRNNKEKSRKFSVENNEYICYTVSLLKEKKINIGKVILSRFIEWIITTIDYKIKNTSNKFSEDKAAILNLNTVELYVESCQEDITKYNKVYKYGSDLLKKYINFLTNKKDFKKEDFLKDEYLNKLLNTLVGCTLTNDKFKFNQNNSTKIFDSENGGVGIIEYINIFKDGDPISNDAIRSDNSLVFKDSEEDIKLPEFILYDDLYKYLKNNSYLDQSFFFYEKERYSTPLTLNSESEENYKNKIDQYCRISGSVTSKIALLCVYRIVRFNYSVQQFNLSKKTLTLNQNCAGINGKYYKEYNSLCRDLGTALINYWNEYIQGKISAAESGVNITNIINNASNYEEYEKTKISQCGYYQESDYFYVDDNGVKKFPSSVFVDIQFKVPRYKNDNTIEEVWIPVSSPRLKKNNEIIDDYIINEYNESNKEFLSPENEMHAGTYFDSFELTDKGGAKEINLTLKSSNDLNLERIIYNSMSLESKKITSQVSQEINFDDMIRAVDANFKIRFGYLDCASDDSDSVIRANDSSEEEFLQRVNKNSNGGKEVKPVLVYPWTYFKIIGLNSNIKDGTDTYNIKGINSGGYALNYLSLGGVDINFSKEGSENKTSNKNSDNIETNNSSDEYIGTPRNVLGKIITWLTDASSTNTNDDEGKTKDLTTARICFLGDNEGSIITDFDSFNSKFKSDEYTYELKGGQKIKGGNIESIPNSFFGKSGQWFSSQSFNLENIYNSQSIKALLDDLIKWLPNRIYYIAKQGGNTMAVVLPYETIRSLGSNFFTQCPFISEKMTYEIIEADARIVKKSGNITSIETPISSDNNDKNWERIYFIRMYYKGPGLISSDKGNGESVKSKEYLRVYNYRSTEQQVIEDINISMNDDEYGNTISTVMILGAGKPVVFSCSEDGKMNNKLKVKSGNFSLSSNEGEIRETSRVKYGIDLGDEIKPFLFFNNSRFINSDVKWDNNTQSAIIDHLSNEAANFFTAQQNLVYTGEMTIAGDPFYYFDSSLEMGVYEILLQMNRMQNYQTYTTARSRYSGIYYITGIRHRIDETGKYTTTLEITKRVIGESSSPTDTEVNEE